MRRPAALICALGLVVGCTGSPGATAGTSTTPAPASPAGAAGTPGTPDATATTAPAPAQTPGPSPLEASAKVTFDGKDCVYTGPKLLPSPTALTIQYAPTPAEEGSRVVVFAVRSTFTPADFARDQADPASGIGLSVPDWVDVWSYMEKVGSGSDVFTLQIERDPPDKTGVFDKWMVSCLHAFPGKPAPAYTLLQLVEGGS